MATQISGGNVIAALCNIFFPGLGQLVQGRLLAALFFAIITFGGYVLWWLIFPAVIAVIFHLWSIINAAKYQTFD
ncbi:MAG: TM2 domain-containing membrane protein YozV [Alteromonadaceae bacterium]|jgi:TM2 domain-containing membrane protein YozV|tara:strand:- start:134 stop:358 length:225 start_codon:yes stop_codon:yes gene_type:complete